MPAAFINSASSLCPEPAGHPATGELDPLTQPGLGLFTRAGLQLDQTAGDMQHGARGVGPFPLGRCRQFLRRQVGPLRPHLLAGMGHLQLDHLAAHAVMDRVDLQQPARKSGRLLIGFTLHRRFGGLQQELAVVGEPPDRLVHQPVPVLAAATSCDTARSVPAGWECGPDRLCSILSR